MHDLYKQRSYRHLWNGIGCSGRVRVYRNKYRENLIKNGFQKEITDKIMRHIFDVAMTMPIETDDSDSIMNAFMNAIEKERNSYGKE